MLNKYTIIYRHFSDSLTPFIGPRILRKDITAVDDVEAASLIPDADILHVIKHEPPDPKEQQLRFLDRELYPQMKLCRAEEGAYLIEITCTPETTVDEVRHELWAKVLDALDLGDVSQCDQYLLDDALNDCDVGDDTPFDLDQWPYDTVRFALVEVDDSNVVAIDWDTKETKVFDQRFEALEAITKNRPENKATLYFELWPGCS